MKPVHEILWNGWKWARSMFSSSDTDNNKNYPPTFSNPPKPPTGKARKSQETVMQEIRKELDEARKEVKKAKKEIQSELEDAGSKQ